MGWKTRREVLRTSGIAASVTGITALAGCAGDNGNGNGNGGNGGGGGNGDDFPSQTIDFIVPFSAGGGTDVYARQFQGVLESELDTNVQVSNEPGGGQWVGYSSLATAEPDGHTIATGALPGSILAALANPPQVDPDDLYVFCGYAQDRQFVVANPEYDQYENDLGAYFDDVRDGENQQIAVLGGQDPEASINYLSQEHDIPFDPIGYDGTAEVMAAVAGDEVPVGVSSDTGSLELVEEGDVLPVGTLAPTRSEILPDAPSVGEDLGFDHLGNGALGQITRPAIVHSDTPQERIDVLENAFEAAVNSDEIQNWAEETNSPIQFIPGEEAHGRWEAAFNELGDYI